MNAETTLNKVREISENAHRRPAAKRLRLKTESDEWRTKRVIVPYEELHPPTRLGVALTASGYKRRDPDARKNQYDQPKDFMAAALEKTAA